MWHEQPLCFIRRTYIFYVHHAMAVVEELGVGVPAGWGHHLIMHFKSHMCFRWCVGCLLIWVCLFFNCFIISKCKLMVCVYVLYRRRVMCSTEANSRKRSLQQTSSQSKWPTAVWKWSYRQIWSVSKYYELNNWSHTLLKGRFTQITNNMYIFYEVSVVTQYSGDGELHLWCSQHWKMIPHIFCATCLFKKHCYRNCG